MPQQDRKPFITLPPRNTENDQRTTGIGQRTSESGFFAEKPRAAWNTSQAPMPRCDFSPARVSLQPHTGGFRSVTLWRRSLYGMTLGEIKQDPQMPDFFASNLSRLIRSVIGRYPDPAQFVIVSPPKRRHPGKENFASRMCAAIAQIIGIPYIDDFAICRTRERVNATFSLGAPVPPQKNIIVIDDIITTGSTLIAMDRLIQSIGRNAMFFAGILNRK